MLKEAVSVRQRHLFWCALKEEQMQNKLRDFTKHQIAALIYISDKFLAASKMKGGQRAKKILCQIRTA